MCVRVRNVQRSNCLLIRLKRVQSTSKLCAQHDGAQVQQIVGSFLHSGLRFRFTEAAIACIRQSLSNPVRHTHAGTAASAHPPGRSSQRSSRTVGDVEEGVHLLKRTNAPPPARRLDNACRMVDRRSPVPPSVARRTTDPTPLHARTHHPLLLHQDCDGSEAEYGCGDTHSGIPSLLGRNILGPRDGNSLRVKSFPISDQVSIISRSKSLSEQRKKCIH